jgi:hypothetical protein
VALSLVGGNLNAPNLSAVTTAPATYYSGLINNTSAAMPTIGGASVARRTRSPRGAPPSARRCTTRCKRRASVPWDATRTPRGAGRARRPRATSAEGCSR